MLYVNDTALTAADDISITEEINGERTLSFFMPWQDAGMDEIKDGSIITEKYVANQQYEVEKVEDTEAASPGHRITCRHVYFQAEKKFIPAFEHRNGASAADIFEDIWSGASDFAVLTAAEITARGMTPTVTLTDMSERSKTDPAELTEALINAIGQGEVYIDNKTIAFVTEIGAQYSTLELDLTKNSDSITVTRDISNLITRLYPFGKDGLDLTDVTGRAYIDSPHISTYGVREGYLDFSEISDNEMLYERALWQFDSDNPSRIDEPYVSINCKFIDLSPIKEGVDRPHLGQHVRVGGYRDKRIIKIVWKPLEPYNTEITVGQISKDLFYYFKKFNNTSNAVSKGDVNIENNPQTITQIVEVTKQEVVAADVIEASAAFIDDLQIERLETNFKNYICLPNITVTNEVPKWDDEAHTWRCKDGYKNAAVRGYIKLYEMQQEYIEAQLVVPSNADKMTADELTAATVNGRQLYFTSIAGSQAFQYLTFTAPTAKYPTMKSEIAAMYVVYKRKSSAEYIKAKNELIWNNADNTYYVRTQYGTGDGQGRGIYTFIKDSDSGRFTYISRTDGLEYGIVEKDDGTYLRAAGVDYKMPPVIVKDTYAEVEAAAANMPDYSLGFWIG